MRPTDNKKEYLRVLKKKHLAPFAPQEYPLAVNGPPVKLEEEVVALADSYGYETGHAKIVAKLALELFNQLKRLHCLRSVERNLLFAAAILHDIGFIKGDKGHHKSSRDIIMQSQLLGGDKTSRTIIALIARYHRKSLPQDRHKLYCQLDKRNKFMVDKLASLLRIADGLDRSHLNLVESLKCEVLADKVIVNVTARRFSLIDAESAKTKADLFERTFGKEILIEWH